MNLLLRDVAWPFRLWDEACCILAGSNMINVELISIYLDPYRGPTVAAW